MEKLFSVSLEIVNPIAFYSDQDRYLKVQLRQTYEGRCLKGAYIARLKKITKISRCRIITNFSGGGLLDVEFLADVLVFSRWDAVIGAKLISKQPMLICEYQGKNKEQVQIFLRPDISTANLAVGQFIPIRIFKSFHIPMKEQISVIGTLLTCDKAFPIYKVEKDSEIPSNGPLAPWIDILQTELEKRQSLTGKDRENLRNFEYLLYSFKVPTNSKNEDSGKTEISIPTWVGGPAWEGPDLHGKFLQKELKQTNYHIENMAEILYRIVVQKKDIDLSGYWLRPLSICRSSPLAIRCPIDKENVESLSENILTVDPLFLMTEFLKNIYNFLSATRELTALHSTGTSYKEHENLWKSMRSSQQ